MAYKNFILIIFCLTLFLYSKNLPALSTEEIKITQQMLQGKVLLTRKFGDNVTIEFLPSSLTSLDGHIIYHYSSNDESIDYKLVDGKIIQYNNDGSNLRKKLLFATPINWIMSEIEDIDGNDKGFTFSKLNRKIHTKVYRVLTLGTDKVSKNYMSHYHSHITNDESIDQLYIHIFGQLDAQIINYKKNLASLNDFLDSSSRLLSKKYKISIELYKIMKNKNIHSNTTSKVTKLRNELESINNLYGKHFKDFSGNELTTAQELEYALDKAAKKITQIQRGIYTAEQDKKNSLAKLDKMLMNIGLVRNSENIKEVEIIGLEYQYKFYKKLLDNPSIWCIEDKDLSQKNPVFFPKLYMIKRLHKKYLEGLSLSKKPYNANEIFERKKILEVKSKELKRRFNHYYLRKILTKANELKEVY